MLAQRVLAQRVLAGGCVLYRVSEPRLSVHRRRCGLLRLALLLHAVPAALGLLAVAAAGAGRVVFRVGVDLSPVEDVLVG